MLWLQILLNFVAPQSAENPKGWYLSSDQGSEGYSTSHLFSVYNIFLTVLMLVFSFSLSWQIIISKGQKPL